MAARNTIPSPAVEAPSRALLGPIGQPCDPARARPLRVTAELAGRLSLPGGPLALDALLGWAVCAAEDAPPALRPEDLRPVEIPVMRSACGRFHLASFSLHAFDHYGIRWINRRFPIPEAQGMAAPSLRRIDVQSGPCKSYRIPIEAGHLEGDEMTWFAVGDAERVRTLIALVTHLGKRRAVGLGRVVRWSVEECESWGEGFPIVSPQGRALRTLPADWPGLSPETERGYRVLTMPYWQRENEELCVMAAGRM